MAPGSKLPSEQTHINLVHAVIEAYDKGHTSFFRRNRAPPRHGDMEASGACRRTTRVAISWMKFCMRCGYFIESAVLLPHDAPDLQVCRTGEAFASPASLVSSRPRKPRCSSGTRSRVRLLCHCTGRRSTLGCRKTRDSLLQPADVCHQILHQSSSQGLLACLVMLGP